MITGDERTAPTFENFAQRSKDQLWAVGSFNKLGDSYARQDLMDDPVSFAFGTVEPPGGAVGNLAKDLGRTAQGKDFKGYFLKSIPLVGDTLYDIWNR